MRRIQDLTWIWVHPHSVSDYPTASDFPGRRGPDPGHYSALDAAVRPLRAARVHLHGSTELVKRHRTICTWQPKNRTRKRARAGPGGG
eukprot:5078045-Prymnesium_polylepis.2